MDCVDDTVSVMQSSASPEAKRAVLDGCDARVGCAAVESLVNRLQARLLAAMPSTDAYVVILTDALHPGFRLTA